MQTDYIDLYRSIGLIAYLHVSPKLDLQSLYQNTQEVCDHMLEVLEHLETLRSAGKIRYLGLSNESAWGTMKISMANLNNLPRIESIQNEYSLLAAYLI